MKLFEQQACQLTRGSQRHRWAVKGVEFTTKWCFSQCISRAICESVCNSQPKCASHCETQATHKGLWIACWNSWKTHVVLWISIACFEIHKRIVNFVRFQLNFTRNVRCTHAAWQFTFTLVRWAFEIVNSPSETFSIVQKMFMHVPKHANCFCLFVHAHFTRWIVFPCHRGTVDRTISQWLNVDSQSIHMHAVRLWWCAMMRCDDSSSDRAWSKQAAAASSCVCVQDVWWKQTCFPRPDFFLASHLHSRSRAVVTQHMRAHICLHLLIISMPVPKKGAFIILQTEIIGCLTWENS